jgi:DNA topoisomerase-1
MPDPEASAEHAGLRYVSDDEPGIRRKRWGRGFTYLDAAGDHITDAGARERFESLSIPPAWTDVWICRHENGHIQATGRDDAGRKQYIYHPAWEEVRNRAKFDRLIPFAEVLPRIRARCGEDLRCDGLPRKKVLAAAVRLLDEGLIRIGNAQYAEKNGSYGLTTLRDRHVSFSDDGCTFSFTGKSGAGHHIVLDDPTLCRVIEQCQDVTGYDLFQYYENDGSRHVINADDVNDYLHAIAEFPATAKDFRTWGGTRTAAITLAEIGAFETKEEARQYITRMVEAVADTLGNTKSVCRQYYIHPGLIDLYRSEQFLPAWYERLPTDPDPHLTPEEQATLHLLRDLRDGALD